MRRWGQPDDLSDRRLPHERGEQMAHRRRHQNCGGFSISSDHSLYLSGRVVWGAADRNLRFTGAELVLLNAVWSRSDGDLLCKQLIDELQWRQDKISMFGRSHDVQRLNAWYGDLIVPTIGQALRWIQFLGPQPCAKSKNALAKLQTLSSTQF